MYVPLRRFQELYGRTGNSEEILAPWTYLSDRFFGSVYRRQLDMNICLFQHTRRSIARPCTSAAQVRNSKKAITQDSSGHEDNLHKKCLGAREIHAQ
jgi:hypothetical protein